MKNLKNVTILTTLLIAGAFLSACGSDNEVHVRIDDSEQRIVSTIELGIIDQINELCTDLYIPSDFQTHALYKQAVANCTFRELAAIGVEGLTGPEEQEIQDFLNQINAENN